MEPISGISENAEKCATSHHKKGKEKSVVSSSVKYVEFVWTRGN